MKSCYIWFDKTQDIVDTIWNRKHKWLGHVLRHSGMLRDILEERMSGKRQEEEDEYRSC